ncbi:MAG: PIN domain-containing protein [Anaerolineae bacterium]
MRAFVDANVLVCFLTGQPPDMAAEAALLFATVEEGRVELVLDAVTLAECVWVLTSFHRLPAARVAHVLAEMLTQEGIVSADKEVLLLALALYRDRNVDFADAVVAARMLSEGETRIYTFDRHFDRFPSLKRLRPRDAG